ncbi:MAG TPA: hypothetical protein VN903_25590 [Polyangia bacterium]|nr:hypothetical protein [Polyangia bacterium]
MSERVYPNRDRTNAHAWFAAHGEGTRPLDAEHHTRACGFVQMVLDEQEAEAKKLRGYLRALLEFIDGPVFFNPMSSGPPPTWAEIREAAKEP